MADRLLPTGWLRYWDIQANRNLYTGWQSTRLHRRGITCRQPRRWLLLGFPLIFSAPHRSDFELNWIFWSATAAAAGLGCQSRRVCAVGPNNVVVVFGRCQPANPRPCGCVCTVTLVCTVNHQVWRLRLAWVDQDHVCRVCAGPWLVRPRHKSLILHDDTGQGWWLMAPLWWECWMGREGWQQTTDNTKQVAISNRYQRL